MIFPANISISRPMGPQPEYVSVSIQDDNSRQRVEFRVLLEDFTKALMGQSAIHGEAQIFSPELLGKTRESERASVVVEDVGYDKSSYQEMLKTGHQKGGWKNEVYLGSQTSVSHGDKGVTLNFYRYRFVESPIYEPTLFRKEVDG